MPEPGYSALGSRGTYELSSGFVTASALSSPHTSGVTPGSFHVRVSCSARWECTYRRYSTSLYNLINTHTRDYELDLRWRAAHGFHGCEACSALHCRERTLRLRRGGFGGERDRYLVSCPIRRGVVAKGCDPQRLARHCAIGRARAPPPPPGRQAPPWRIRISRGGETRHATRRWLVAVRHHEPRPR